MIDLTVFISLVVFTVGCSSANRVGSKDYIIAIAKGERTLNVMDANSGEILKKFKLGQNPHEIEISSENIAYVSNTENGNGKEINVLDLNSLVKKQDIDTGYIKGPHGLSSREDHLWMTAQGSKSVARINTKENSVDLLLGTGEDRTHLIYTTRDGKNVYTTNIGSGTISLFSYEFVKPHLAPTGKLPPGLKGRMEWVHRKIKAVYGIEGFHVSPDEKELWAIAPDNTNIFIIDLKSKKLINTLDTKKLGGHRLKFSPDGKIALITNIREKLIQVFDTKKKKLIKEFEGCKGESILFPPTHFEARNRVYISCTMDSRISVIDLNNFKEIKSFPIGAKPDGIAWWTRR